MHFEENTATISRSLLEHPDLIDEIDVISSHYGLTGLNELTQLFGATPDALIDIYIDDLLIEENFRIYAKGDRLNSYHIRGLKDTKHTVRIVVKGGTFTLDGIDIIKGKNKVEVNKGELQKLYDTHKDKNHKDYTKESWKVFHKALQTAKEALKNPQSTLEKVGAAQLGLEVAEEELIEQ